jgi:L-rhamnonate dehydratase
MRIVDVEAIVLRPSGGVDDTIADGSQDALVIRVSTDEGIVGYGEVDSLPPVVKAAVEAPPSHKMAKGLRSLLVGEDPLRPDVLWEKLYRGSIYYGRRGVAIHAISGVEIALWDICGKALGVPVHVLLGGARRSRVPAYASMLMPTTIGEVRDAVSEQRRSGFRGVKLGYGPLGASLEDDVALVAAAREAAGPNMDLMVDVGHGWQHPRRAIDCARAMADLRLYWIEEPFAPDELGKYRMLAQAVDTPLAAGEQETSLFDFERLLEAGVSVLQPDVTRAGGIRQCLRVAELAQRTGSRCVLHAWSTGIIKAASLHVLAAMAEAEYLEYCVQPSPLAERLVSTSFPVVDGYVSVPQQPGLGIEVDESVITAFRVD